MQKELGLQIDFHRKLIGQGKGNSKTRITNGVDAAHAMLHNPQVAWVGVSDLWWESMVTLEHVLGVPVLKYALLLHSRMEPDTFWARQVLESVMLPREYPMESSV